MTQNQVPKPVTVADIKLACKITAETLQESSSSNYFKLQIGMLLAPQGGLSTTQAATLLRKFNEALNSFKEDAEARLTLNLEVDSAESNELTTSIAKIGKEAQVKMQELQKNSQEIMDIAQKRLTGIMQAKLNAEVIKVGAANEKEKAVSAVSDDKAVPKGKKG